MFQGDTPLIPGLLAADPLHIKTLSSAVSVSFHKRK